MGVLIGMCANDSRASAALAVPFLIRIATDPHHPHYTDALGGLAAPARARHVGVASRDELLLHRSSPQHRVLDGYDGYGAEVTGYPAGWSVAAARTAITAATPMLLPLLNDSDVTTRINASYALATAADPDRRVRSAFATRFDNEQDPVALVELGACHGREHPCPLAPTGHSVDPRAVAGPCTGSRSPPCRRDRLALSHQ